MAPDTAKVMVRLGPRTYAVHISPGLLGRVGRHLAAMGYGGKAAVITQTRPGRLFSGVLATSLREAGFEPHLFVVPEGEEAKSLKEARALYEFFIRRGLDRWSPVLALGGGTVGDLAGFAAGTFMRGLPFFQVPTTLVSQVDSSIGGKVAVNHPRGKNIIGLFYQPKAVFIDPSTLKTLPRRDRLAGLAEIIRYAAIADARFFAFLERNHRRITAGETSPLVAAIKRSAAIKAAIVEADETEQKDTRALLNYGHTLGHAVEAATGFSRWRHGEAVAIGMAAAARLAFRLGACLRPVMERQITLLKNTGLPVTLRGISNESILNSLKLDKKIRHGKLRFVLTEAIGRAKVIHGVNSADIVEAMAVP